MEVTASGVPRQRRVAIQALVERLRGRYSGALNVGATAAVVVEGTAVDWTAPKLAAARTHGIAVVTTDWLEDSALHGFLLCPANYALAPGQSSQQAASANSTSLAPAACPPPAEPLPAPPASPPAATVASKDSGTPEVEQLRGEAQPPLHSPLAAPFLELPPLPAGLREASPARKDAQQAADARQPLVALDADRAQLPSPASPAAGQRRGSPLQALPLLPSPLALGGADLLLPLVAADEEMGPVHNRGSPGAVRGQAAQTPERAHSQEQGSGRDASDGIAARHVAEPAAAAEAEEPFRESLMATPIVGAACSGSGGGSSRRSETGAQGGGPLTETGTDSDTLVSRFLSRMPQVTLARGSRLPRWLPPDSSSSESTTSCDSSGSSSVLSSCDGCGTAERRDGWRFGGRSRNSGGDSNLGGLGLRLMDMEDADTGDRQAQGLQSAVQQGGPAAPAARSPIEAEQQQQQEQQQEQGEEGLLRCDSPVEGRLPATTLIRLGPPQLRPPAQSTLDGIAERHCSDDGTTAGDGEVHVAFFKSTEALPVDGPPMVFVAGDTSHGACLLYDIHEDGQREYALALVQAIYRVGDEAWMEHRYLFSREDLLKRPRWAAAVGTGACSMRQDELLLSAGSYHSPMHLIFGDFSLSFPGHVLRSEPASRVNSQRRRQGHPVHVTSGRERQQAYTCRRGFDAAGGAVVPLRRALEGFAG